MFDFSFIRLVLDFRFLGYFYAIFLYIPPERCIGVLKNRFPILKLMPNYPIRKQRRIPVACCVVHNFIRMQSRNDTLFQQFENNDVDVVDEESSGANQEGENMHLNDDNVMNDVRDHIAGSMWLDYVNNN